MPLAQQQTAEDSLLDLVRGLPDSRATPQQFNRHPCPRSADGQNIARSKHMRNTRGQLVPLEEGRIFRAGGGNQPAPSRVTEQRELVMVGKLRVVANHLLQEWPADWSSYPEVQQTLLSAKSKHGLKVPAYLTGEAQLPSR